MQVVSHQLIQTSHRLLNIQLTKVRNQPVIWQDVGVHNNSLDILQVIIVLQSSLEQAGLLAQFTNAWLVIVAEHLVTQNSISNLWSMQQVNLQKLCLQVAICRRIVLKSI